MSRFKPYISIWVYTKDSVKDDNLATLAAKFNGDHEGSGYGFGARDNSFSFYDLKQAYQFSSKLNKIKWVTRWEAHLNLE